MRVLDIKKGPHVSKKEDPHFRHGTFLKVWPDMLWFTMTRLADWLFVQYVQAGHSMRGAKTHTVLFVLYFLLFIQDQKVYNDSSLHYAHRCGLVAIEKKKQTL